MFDRSEYEVLSSLVFRPDYSGYKPTVIEIPNGDGKADAAKRYAHVAFKYFANDWQRAALTPYLERAHAVAVAAGKSLGLPPEFMPDIRYGALRVLDYPPGAVSNRHEDFDLFTLMCYRDQPDCFVAHEKHSPYVYHRDVMAILRSFNEQAHLGQIGEEIGLGPATPHEVVPSETPQRSIVYFSIPDHDSVLASGISVRDWLNERMARSRTEFKSYE